MIFPNSSDRTGRSLRQEELDAYHRQAFICAVLDALTMEGKFMHQGRLVRFVVRKSKYNLVEIRNMGGGEFEFQIGGEYRYCYHMSVIIAALEKFYDAGAEIISLRGEIQLEIIHATANPDAEPNSNETPTMEVTDD